MKLYLEDLRQGLLEAMQENSKVVLLGEDILDPYGGAFKVTKGLSSRFPNRVYTTPISEGAITGLSTGLAIRGLRPIAEIMFGDFLTLCTDQIVNSAAKFPLMYRDSVTVPSMIRTPVGGARGYGPTHSQCLEKMFFGIPGLNIVAPCRAHQPGKMVKHLALNATSPSIFIEDKGDYSARLVVDGVDGLSIFYADNNDPLSAVVVDNFDAGTKPDITVFGYGGAASIAIDAIRQLKKEEIYVRLVAPARINDISELSALSHYLNQQTPILIVEQGTQGFNWGSEVISQLVSAIPKLSTINRLAAKADVIPSARHLEDEVILTTQKITDSIIGMLS